MILFDIIKKETISVDKFNIEIKRKFKNSQLRLLNETELKKSKKDFKNYSEYINNFKTMFSSDDSYLPLYDINNNFIYFIFKSNIYNYITNYKFRPVNLQLIEFLKENKKENEKLLKLINFFDLDILEKNLLKFIFYNTKEIGSDISFLMNPAFISFLNINPFLKKSSIVNTAQNLGLINNDKLSNYNSNEKIKDLYNKIKYIFFSRKELLSHIKHITDHKMSKVINFYTMYGAFFLNNYIRNPEKNSYDDNAINQINKLTKLIKNAPKLNSSKIIFRFIKSVPNSLKKINIGEIYTESSFMSCTRKPHVDAINEQFGFILLKINLPKDFPGCCLSIESDSVFPEEKEVILAPGSKFRLDSVDDNVDFYSFNKLTDQNIKKKYELTFIGFDDISIPKYEILKIPEINFVRDEIIGDGLEEKITYFWDNYGKFNRRFNLILPNGEKKLLYCNYYNSTDTYQKFFYYKIDDGFFFYGYNENYEIDLFIEVGDEIIVNFPSRSLAIDNNKNTKIISSLIAYGFKVNKINLYPDYIRASDVGNDSNYIFTSRIYVNEILFKFIKNTKIIDFHLDKFELVKKYLDSKPNNDKINFNLHKYSSYSKISDLTWIEMFKEIINENPLDIKYFLVSIPSRIRHLYYDFFPYQYLLNNNIINIIPTTSSKYEYKKINKSPEFFSIHMNNFRTLVK